MTRKVAAREVSFFPLVAALLPDLVPFRSIG